MASLSRTSPRGRWSLAGVAAFIVLALSGLSGPLSPAVADVVIPRPIPGPVVCGSPIVISDSRAGEIVAVHIGQTSASIWSRTATSVTVICPAGASGAVTIRYSDGTTRTYGGSEFEYIPQVPTTAALSPKAGLASGGNAVEITGTNLANVTNVTFGAKGAVIVSKTATSLQVTAPPGIDGTSVDVVVTNADGSSSPLTYDYGGVPAPPGITNLAPNLGPAAGGNNVKISGSGLADATRVTFGGKDATIAAKSATEVTVIAPAGSVGAPVSVIVTGPNGSSDALPYTYELPPPHASVSGISPEFGTMQGGDAVRLSGTNLNLATKVTFGTKEATITAKSATTLDVVTPSGSFGTDVPVVVTTALGTTQPVTFRYGPLGPIPQTTALAPDHGSRAGGETVRILGNNLEGVTTVTFGGKTATIIEKTSTFIDVLTPAFSGTSTDVDVVVTSVLASTTPLTYSYEWVDAWPPEISSISPDHGPAVGGNEVAISGTWNSSITSVSLGGKPAEVVAQTGSKVTVRVPAGTPGASAEVLLRNREGVARGLEYRYDAQPAPVKHAYDLSGSASLKALTRGTFAVGGTADLTFDPEGGVSGPIALRDTTARLVTAGVIPLTAKLGFVPAGDAVGTLDDAGGLKLAYRARIKVKELKLFGTLSLAVGTNCQTRSAALIPLAATVFDPDAGGALAGAFSLSNLTGCGALNGLVSPLTAGSGNTIAVKLAPRSDTTAN